MPNSDSITPLPLDPELLGELLEKVPAEVIEQLTHNWRKQTEALARSEKENRLLRELLRLMRVEKYGPASERLSDYQLEVLEQEPGSARRSNLLAQAFQLSADMAMQPFVGSVIWGMAGTTSFQVDADEAVQDVMQATGMLDNTKQTVERARAAGATIVHVPIQFAPGFREVSETPYGILKGCKDGDTFEKGSWGAKIVDALKPKPQLFGLFR